MAKRKKTAKRIQPAQRVTQIEQTIHVIRGQRVLLDSDLAKMDGVPTKVFNQAVKRNAERFPEDFAYRLTEQEVTILRSQIVTQTLAEAAGDIDLGSSPSKASPCSRVY